VCVCECAVLSTEREMRAPNLHLWSLLLYIIFTYYLINDTIKINLIECTLCFDFL
jgi:hypothetical protein